MTIMLIKSAGFCFGVKKTVELALDESARKGDIYTLGPIIHNTHVVNYLETKKIHVAEKIDDIPDGTTVIIRTHGATVDDLKNLKKRELTVVDGTCPFVIRPQRMVKRLSNQGYFVVIVGDEKHPEIKGVKSRADGNVAVINPANPDFRIPEAKKLAVVAQTTLPAEDFESVIRKLQRPERELMVVNTICRDTSIRQSESKKLAGDVGALLVLGGRNSANTNKLARLCREINSNTYHIESEDEIDPAWLNGKDRVGLTTGASTPDWLIERIIRRLREIDPKSTVEQVG